MRPVFGKGKVHFSLRFGFRKTSFYLFLSKEIKVCETTNSKKVNQNENSVFSALSLDESTRKNSLMDVVLLLKTVNPHLLTLSGLLSLFLDFTASDEVFCTFIFPVFNVSFLTCFLSLLMLDLLFVVMHESNVLSC